MVAPKKALARLNLVDPAGKMVHIDVGDDVPEWAEVHESRLGTAADAKKVVVPEEDDEPIV